MNTFLQNQNIPYYPEEINTQSQQTSETSKTMSEDKSAPSQSLNNLMENLQNQANNPLFGLLKNGGMNNASLMSMLMSNSPLGQNNNMLAQALNMMNQNKSTTNSSEIKECNFDTSPYEEL